MSSNWLMDLTEQKLFESVNVIASRPGWLERWSWVVQDVVGLMLFTAEPAVDQEQNVTALSPGMALSVSLAPVFA